jgi:tRNA-binding protein
MSNIIENSDFHKVKMMAGTIIDAKLNEKAIRPAYILTLDFGELGYKTSSAQLTQNYQCEDLKGKQVIAVMNFEAKRIAGIKSEVLVLAATCKQQGTVLLHPGIMVSNGCGIA